jgi:hypothetical protein
MGNVTTPGDIGIFNRIQINGSTVGMLGPLFVACRFAAVECGGVVRFDRSPVVPPKVTDQTHLSDRISDLIKAPEDPCNIFGHLTVHDQFTGSINSLKITISDMDITQIPQRYRTPFVPGSPFDHTIFDMPVDG